MQSRLKPLTGSAKLALHTATSGSTHKDRRRPKEDPRRFRKSLEKAQRKHAAADADTILDIASKEVAAAPQRLAQPDATDIGTRIDVQT